MGNPSPSQTVERASSEGRVIPSSLAGHGHPHESEVNYAHPFQHMLHHHSGWSTNESGGGGGGGGGGGSGGGGPITGGVGTGSASSLASSSSNEGTPSGGSMQQVGSSGHSGYHGEKYKYDPLNEADANADNRFVLEICFLP